MRCFTLLSKKQINEWSEEVMKLFDLTLIEILIQAIKCQ